ncbi:HEAT repeat domain-containing protein [Streptomyces sp. ISL-66]|uniref:HEAT repeat domain-containing protein n=1 Tax=Streptomyces sp. ISL-66 TaxID=2819186 RepID=UPI0020359C20|nr:HEAT repeat domain-containing protein [Streptomyces sp. ISL-66]
MLRLAGNAAAPNDVLLRLLTDPDDMLVRAVARRPDLPLPVVETVLTHPNIKVRIAYAESPHAEPAQRARLLDDPSPRVHLALASGPFPDGITPVRPLPEHAYQRLLTHPSGLVRSESLSSPTIPPQVLADLWNHPDPAFREAACRAWAALPDSAQQALLNDADADVRHAALLSLPCPDENQMEQLVTDLAGSWKLTDALSVGRLTRDLAERLTADPTYQASVARNPSLPADLVRTLVTSPDPHVRLLVSTRPEWTEKERAGIDYHVAPEQHLGTLSWVLEGQHDPALLRRCATSSHVWLRRSAAACPTLPADLVPQLAADDDLAVRLLLCENHPGAPAELLLDLYLNGTHRAVGMLETHPNFPTHGLAGRFAGASDPVRKRLALRDPDLDPDVLDALSRDPDTRDRAATDTRLPLPRLRQILADPATGYAAAGNAALPVVDMHRLLDHAGVASR